MWNNLKLRQKILAGYSIPVVIFFLTAMYGAIAVRQVRHTFEEIERVENILQESKTMELASSGMIRSVRGFVATKDAAFADEYTLEKQNFEEALSALQGDNGVKVEEQKQRLKTIADANHRYEKIAERMIALVQQGKTAEAIQIIKNEGGREIDALITKLDKEFDEAEKALLTQEIQKAEAALDGLFWTLLLAAVVLSGVSAAIAFVISGGVTQTITQSASLITSSSSEIAATVEQQERTASQQAAAVNETTTTMDELGASSRQSTEQADAAAGAAQEVLKLTDSGNHAVQETLEGMEDLQKKVAAIAEQTMRLSEQTNQIGNISQVVTDLANQTNMLALNAAVEAVRAGEQGKGFSVVATEIRKLADQSKQSAEKIGVLVSDIQNAINVTVMVTDEGTKTVRSEMEIAQRTAQTFASVAESINNVVINNQQISLNIRQQNKAVQQVLEAMGSINQGAQETASGLNQTKIGTKQLNEASLELLAII